MCGVFLVKIYNYLLSVIFGFILIEVVFFKMGWVECIVIIMFGVNWFFVFGGFVVVSWIVSCVVYIVCSLLV